MRYLELVINEKPWRIFKVHEKHPMITDNDKQGEYYVLGMTYPQRRNIYIDCDNDITTIEETALHEMTHAYMCAHGFGEMSCGKAFTNEFICEFMSLYGQRIVRDSERFVSTINEIQFLEV